MSFLDKIKQRYFYGISVKLFFIAKVFICFLLILSFYPNIMVINIAGLKVSFISIMSIVFILLLSYSYNKLLAKPLIEINKTVSKLADLNFDNSLNISSNDELGELSKNLNFLSNKLESTMSQLEKELEKNVGLLEQQKRFTDDLTHEIKTPLSVITAYSEALLDNISPDLKSKYLKTIINETNRLDELLVELLNLSAYEAGTIGVCYERFDLVELVEEIAGRFLIDTALKEFSVICDFPDTPVYISADKKQITKAFSNIILNAYKYVLENGVIKLSITKELSRVNLKVYNTCAHIEESNLTLIWQRFYRVDNSRAKKTGGSGLGLAIAAHIFKLHNFRYEARNKQDGIEIFIEI